MSGDAFVRLTIHTNTFYCLIVISSSNDNDDDKPTTEVSAYNNVNVLKKYFTS